MQHLNILMMDILDGKYLRTGPLCPVAPAQTDRMDTNRYCNARNIKHYTKNTPAGAYFADNLTHQFLGNLQDSQSSRKGQGSETEKKNWRICLTPTSGGEANRVDIKMSAGDTEDLLLLKYYPYLTQINQKKLLFIWRELKCFAERATPKFIELV